MPGLAVKAKRRRVHAMERDSADAKGSDLGWVSDVSDALSNAPETCNLWLKLFETLETQSPSVAKNYLMSVFETLRQQTTDDIERIRESVDKEAKYES
jgi:hypothetical protein